MIARTPRSWLIVPAHKPTDIAAAARSGADAIVVDLVEFVPEEGKAAARAKARDAIEAARASGAAVFVQTAPDALQADLPACVSPGLAGIVVSRVESASQIMEASTLLARLEREQGVPPDTLEIVAAVESARGNHAAHEIAGASPRVTGLTLGRADLVMDLRAEPSGEIHLMQYLMQRLIIIAGVAGVTPIGAWWRAPDRGLLATPENTLAAAQRGRSIGFTGAMCLRHEQVGPLNQAYA